MDIQGESQRDLPDGDGLLVCVGKLLSDQRKPTDFLVPADKNWWACTRHRAKDFQPNGSG
jgi:hypothetical protein